MIYVIKEEENSYYKIGYTSDNDPMKRLRSLQTGSPHELRLLGTFPGEINKEKELHNKFWAQRIRSTGEWFYSTEQEMISLIIQEGGSLYEEPKQKKKDDDIIASINRLTKVIESKDEEIENLQKKLSTYEVIGGAIDKHIRYLFRDGKMAEIQRQSGSSAAVYFFLFSNRNEHDEVKIGLRKIANSCGCSTGTTHNAIKVLQEKKLIKLVRSGRQGNIYKILL